jgi:hypothetical protein
MYRDLGLFSTHILISWCTTKDIGVSRRLDPIGVVELVLK